jgi:hypothetical protein
MVACWHRDPSIRPLFLDIMNRLCMLKEGDMGKLSHDGSSTSRSILPFQSFNSTSSISVYGSLGHTSSSSGSRTELPHASEGDQDGVENMTIQEIVPRLNVSFVVCDLVGMGDLWQSNPSKAAKMTSTFIKSVRKHCDTYSGFVFSRSTLHSGGTFMLAFSKSTAALAFASAVQTNLLTKNRKARISLDYLAGIAGSPKDSKHRLGGFGSGVYFPESVDPVCRINLECPPGAIVCTSGFAEHLKQDPDHTGHSNHASLSEDLVLLIPPSLEGEGGEGHGSEKVKQMEPKDDDQGYNSKEGLCSSNACPWIINSGILTIEEVIGEGNYGCVSKAFFCPGRNSSASVKLSVSSGSAQVAVKRLYRNRLDDESMLKLRKEAAILSQIDHPNVVRLIGLSIADDRLMLVTELVPCGSLRSLLSNNHMVLSWPKRLTFLRDAALGIAHLHSVGIIHRDIKSSNLLVDSDGHVKVGDFGFATAKADNGTLTRCGTPSWTAPEILIPPSAVNVETTKKASPLRYSEKADIYSFGIVMWEVLTRRMPYQDRNMMFVVVEVLDGYRPKVPGDCPHAFADLMQRCWRHEPEHRPDIDEVILYLNSELTHDSS